MYFFFYVILFFIRLRFSLRDTQPMIRYRNYSSIEDFFFLDETLSRIIPLTLLPRKENFFFSIFRLASLVLYRSILYVDAVYTVPRNIFAHSPWTSARVIIMLRCQTNAVKWARVVVVPMRREKIFLLCTDSYTVFVVSYYRLYKSNDCVSSIKDTSQPWTYSIYLLIITRVSIIIIREFIEKRNITCKDEVKRWLFNISCAKSNTSQL